jgi:hypothetical protein
VGTSGVKEGGTGVAVAAGNITLQLAKNIIVEITVKNTAALNTD